MNIIKEIKLSYSTNGMENIKITDSSSAYKILIDNWDLDTIQLQEEFKVLLLNRANIVLGIYNMSKGGVSGTIVDVKLLLTAALKSNASGIIVAHNHPSGNLKPSDNDLSLTRKIKEGAKLLDIILLDHIIVTNTGFYSFSDSGELMKGK
jgi:DNA repair protein RadC